MKTRQIIVLFLIAISFATGSRAQKTLNNSINLNHAAFYIPNRYKSPNPTRFVGLFYSRRISKKIYGCVGISKWQHGRNFGEVYNIWEPLEITDTAYGTLVRRTNYKMADVSALYMYEVIKGHRIYMGIGASYTWGMNSYIESMSIPVMPLYGDVWYSYEKHEAYWGVIPQVSYNYSFLNNRFNVGIDLKARFYNGIQQA